jgi:plasmid stabilization system protein ParE
MVKRKIVWSVKAKDKLFSILEFYTLRNQSKFYSVRLHRKIFKEIKLLIKHPDLGIKTDEKTIRGLIVEAYIIFYEVTIDKIIIFTIWDCRQDPVNKVLK